MELPSIVSAGICDSRVVRKNAIVSKGRKTTMFEIELSMEEGGVSYIESESMPIRRGTVVSAKPDQMRHSKFPRRQIWQLKNLQVQNNAVSRQQTSRQEYQSRCQQEYCGHIFPSCRSAEMPSAVLTYGHNGADIRGMLLQNNYLCRTCSHPHRGQS